MQPHAASKTTFRDLVVGTLTTGLITGSVVLAQPAPAPTTTAATPPSSATQAATPAATRATATPASSTRATSRPANFPRLIIPPGFVRLDIGNRRFLLEPADEQLLRAAVADITPATRPSTMPSDLLASLQAHRAELIDAVKADLGVSAEVAAKLPDERLRPAIESVESYVPQNVMMLSTSDKLVALGKAGWENPALYYNRATGEVRATRGINLVDDPEDARGLVPLAEDPKADPAKRQANLATVLRFIDGQMMSGKAQSGIFAVQTATFKYIVEEGLGKLDLKLDQAWFSNGVTGVLGTKYVALIASLPERAVIEAIINEPRNTPVRVAMIDLLSPPETNSLRREAVPYFLDALRRKSVRAIDELTLRHGDRVIPMLIAAIAEAKPKDGAALVALIQQKTGTDLTPYLRSGEPPAPLPATQPAAPATNTPR